MAIEHDEAAPQDATGPRRGRKGQRRRKEILDTAREILLEEGWASLALRDVALRLGMTHGNLQYYFPTKDDLLLAVFDEEVAKYTTGLHEAASAASSRRARLEAIVDSALEEMLKPEVRLWYVAYATASHTPEIREVLRRENERYREALALELGEIASELSEQRRRHLAQLIQALLDGVALQLSYAEPTGADAKALFREMKAAVVTLIDAD
jgi:AcrR family transcriptional regulator